MMQRTHYRQGVRITGPMVSLVANSTALTLADLPAGRTGIIRKLRVNNRGGATSRVQIGTGTAPFVQSLPDIFTVGGGMDLVLTEEELPNFEFTADITVQATVAAAAPNDVQVQAEVEQFPNTAG